MNESVSLLKKQQQPMLPYDVNDRNWRTRPTEATAVFFKNVSYWCEHSDAHKTPSHSVMGELTPVILPSTLVINLLRSLCMNACCF